MEDLYSELDAILGLKTSVLNLLSSEVKILLKEYLQENISDIQDNEDFTHYLFELMVELWQIISTHGRSIMLSRNNESSDNKDIDYLREFVKEDSLLESSLYKDLIKTFFSDEKTTLNTLNLIKASGRWNSTFNEEAVEVLEKIGFEDKEIVDREGDSDYMSRTAFHLLPETIQFKLVEYYKNTPNMEEN